MSYTSDSTIHNGDRGNGASYFQKTVTLWDWWLIRAENDFNGKRTAVAGLTSGPGEPVRIFSSAPIRKRYDIFTLETADGICVVLRGFINKQRTTDNGFTSEVFKQYVFGFPPEWETHAAKAFEGGTFDIATTGNISDTNDLLSNSENAGVDDCTPTNTNSSLRISPSKEVEEKLNVTPRNVGSRNCGRSRNPRSPSCKNLDAEWKKQVVAASGSNIERREINSATECSGYVTNIDQVNEQEGSVEYGSPMKNDARQGINRGAVVAEKVMKGINASKKSEYFTAHKNGVDIHDEETGDKRKDHKASRKKVKRKILSSPEGSPITKQRKEKSSIISPECLSYGRSRSGRLLLPKMEFWRNQLPVYDADRRIKGIQEPAGE